MPNGVICGGAVDGSNQLGDIVTCHAMATRPDGTGPAAIDAVAPKTSTVTASEPMNARRSDKPLKEIMRCPFVTGLQHSPSAQLLHFCLGHAETAEDLGVVLTELWGDGAHPHAPADLDRGADVRDVTQLRVVRVLDQAAVAHLRVAEH